MNREGQFGWANSVTDKPMLTSENIVKAAAPHSKPRIAAGGQLSAGSLCPSTAWSGLSQLGRLHVLARCGLCGCFADNLDLDSGDAIVRLDH